MEYNLPHLMPLCFSALASLETSSFLFAHLCSHDTKHTACSQALGSISAAQASTFASAAAYFAKPHCIKRQVCLFSAVLLCIIGGPCADLYEEQK